MSVSFCIHRVHPRYPVAGDWRASTPWEMVEGRYQRRFRSASARGAVRTAVVYRSGGGWRWRVTERGRSGRVAEVGRSAAELVYTLGYNAFNPAEVSATTK